MRMHLNSRVRGGEASGESPEAPPSLGVLENFDLKDSNDSRGSSLESVERKRLIERDFKSSTGIRKGWVATGVFSKRSANSAAITQMVVRFESPAHLR